MALVFVEFKRKMIETVNSHCVEMLTVRVVAVIRLEIIAPERFDFGLFFLIRLILALVGQDNQCEATM